MTHSSDPGTHESGAQDRAKERLILKGLMTVAPFGLSYDFSWCHRSIH